MQFKNTFNRTIEILFKKKFQIFFFKQILVFFFLFLINSFFSLPFIAGCSGSIESAIDKMIDENEEENKKKEEFDWVYWLCFIGFIISATITIVTIIDVLGTFDKFDNPESPTNSSRSTDIGDKSFDNIKPKNPNMTNLFFDINPETYKTSHFFDISNKVVVEMLFKPRNAYGFQKMWWCINRKKKDDQNKENFDTKK